MSEYESTNHPTKRTKTGKPYSIQKHRAVWIEHHGEIPEGMVIHHINGNKKDNRIENLECLTRKEHAKRHLKTNRKRTIYPSGAVKVEKIEEEE